MRPLRTLIHVFLVRRESDGGRSDEDNDGRRRPRVPRLVQAALENLREVAVERLKDNGDTEAKVVEVLARAAAELKKS